MIKVFSEEVFYLIISLLPRIPDFNKLRSALLRMAGVNIGKKVVIWSGFDLRPYGGLDRLYIGGQTFVNVNCRIGLGAKGRLVIGKRVAVGPNVSFETVNHMQGYNKKWASVSKSIYIGNDAWIGSGAIALSGVTAMIIEGCN